MKGSVKSYSARNGYGFITADGQDYRFKPNQWNLLIPPCAGLNVQFEPQETEKGLRAINIKEEK